MQDIRCNLRVTTGDNARTRAAVIDLADEVGHGVDGVSVGTVGQEVGEQISGIRNTLHGEIAIEGALESGLEAGTESSLFDKLFRTIPSSHLPSFHLLSTDGEYLRHCPTR